MRKKSPITLRQIAERAEVAPVTVSRVLNRHPSISLPTVERVTRAARELGYDISPKRRVIALLLPDVAGGSYFSSLYEAVRREAKERGWILESFEFSDVEFLQERLISGILALDFTPGSVRKFCDQYSLPLVSINNAHRHPDQAREVFSNNRKAMADAVGYLAGYGHRRIGYLYASSVNLRRVEAFQEACRKSGISTGDACFQIPGRKIDRKYCTLFHGAIGEVIAQKLTAVILSGENGGPNLLAALRELRVRVPEDLSVIAWETPQVSEHLEPPLTTFEQDFRGMAAAAFGILDELMNRRPVAADVAVDYLFHERRSVASPGR